MSWKSKLAGVLCVAACALFLLPGPARAQDEADAPPAAPYPGAPVADQNVSFQTFYDSLAGEGTWIQTDDYGYVWQPRIDDPNWAPYTNGHWAYTEDEWTWVSDEPWGWAVYHYGRWVNLDGVGWCWVPGYTWAPAWVSWRYGDGYCGWAPLPPDSLVGIDYEDGDVGEGFHIGGDCDDYYGIGAGWYVFLPVGYFGEGDYRGYYANRRDNDRIRSHTTNVTNLNLTRNTAGATGGAANFNAVTLGGPSLRQVDAASQSPVPEATLAFTNRVGGGEINGRSLAIYAPQVDLGTVHNARPQAVSASMGRVAINRGTDLSRPLLASSHFSAGAAMSRPASPNGAVVNEAVPRSAVSAPLTTLRPMSFPSGAGSTYGRPAYSNTETYRPPASAYGNSRVESGGGSFRAAPSESYHGAPAENPGGGAYYNNGTGTPSRGR